MSSWAEERAEELLRIERMAERSGLVESENGRSRRSHRKDVDIAIQEARWLVKKARVKLLIGGTKGMNLLDKHELRLWIEMDKALSKAEKKFAKFFE